MRRFAKLFSVLALIVASMAASMSAQDATPPPAPAEFPESFEIAPGVVADSMLFFEGAEAPSVYRLTFDAGVVYPVMASPNLELGYLESGSLVMTLDAPALVRQVGNLDGEGETFDAGTEFTLEAGDYMVLQPGVSGEIRNDSDQPAVLSVAGLTPAGSSDATSEASPEG